MAQLPPRRLVLVGAGALAAGALGLWSLRGKGPEKVSVAGASSLRLALQDIARAFERDRRGAAVTVRGGGEARALEGLRQGSVDVASCLGPVPSGAPGEASRLGRDGLALVVHRTNRVPGLQRVPVAELFAGLKDNWEGYGADPGPIAVLSRPEGDGLKALFEDHFGLRRRVLPSALEVDGDSRVLEQVAHNPGAIGYVSLASALAAVEDGMNVRPVPLEDVQPTLENVRAERWPVLVDLSLRLREGAPDAARALVAYARGPGGRRALTTHRFVPL
jgi:phosphate transport system substrate-binding protein